jgi:hypothetical protein
MERRLISKKLRGLSEKSARSGPRVDFTRVQGPLCKIFGITRITNYFRTVNPVHRVHARWAGAHQAVHRGPTVAQTDGTAVRSPEMASGPPVRQSSPAGAQKRERSTGRLARASPELGRRCSDQATAVQNREAAALGERAAQAWIEVKRSGERCGETR